MNIHFPDKLYKISYCHKTGDWVSSSIFKYMAQVHLYVNDKDSIMESGY